MKRIQVSIIIALAGLIVFLCSFKVDSIKSNDASFKSLIPKVQDSRAIQSESYRCRADSNCTNSYSATISFSGTTATVNTSTVSYSSGDSLYCAVYSGATVTVSGNDAIVSIPTTDTWWYVPWDPNGTPTIVNGGSDEVFQCICLSGVGGCSPVTTTRGGVTITICKPSGSPACMGCDCIGGDVSGGRLPGSIIKADEIVFNNVTYN